MRKGDFYLMLQQVRENSMTRENIVSAWRASGMIPFNHQRVLQNPNLQLNSSPVIPLAARYSGLRPLEGRDGRAQEVNEVRKKTDQLGDIGDATVLLHQAIDLAEKAQTQSILDQATIKQLQALQPSKPDRRQIKGGLLLHTKVLGELDKKREKDDLKKQAIVEAGRIKRAKDKRQ